MPEQRRHSGASALALLGLGSVIALSNPTALEATPACDRAREIVRQVERALPTTPEQHQQTLSLLRTAQALCPDLAKAWFYAACSAEAIRDARAAYFRDRARRSGSDAETCPGSPTPTPPPSPLPLGPVHRKYALVVGIGRFRDPAIPALRFAAKDAASVAALLRDPDHGRFSPADVTLLTDEDATHGQILTALHAIAVSAREDDLVVVFISSHGLPGAAGLGLTGRGHIVTYDTLRDAPYLDGLAFDDLKNMLGSITARRKVTLLDTCFSGRLAQQVGAKALTIDRGYSQDALKHLITGTGDYIIASSGSGEESWESDKLQQGFFTHFLIQALRGGTKSPPTLREVFDSLVRHVPQAVSIDKGGSQHPQMYPEGAADLRIGVKPLSYGAERPQDASGAKR